jgi:hypothetical protein
MRKHLTPQSRSETLPPLPAQGTTELHLSRPLPLCWPRIPGLTIPGLAILGEAALLVFAQALAGAQTPASQPAAPAAIPGQAPDQNAVPAHKHPRAVQSPPVVAPVVLAPITPPVPATPNWPAFNQAAQASVLWDSHGLSIDAANSSLQQILKDVSTATGTTVEGLTTDQRVFGSYGPGQARDVLSQLLQGSGYNVLMIGDQGQGVPRQLLLSARQGGGGQAAPAGRPSQPSSDEEDADEPAPNQDPGPTSRPGFTPGYPPAEPPGAPVRTPQELMQDLQQRQQQQQQQQQQQPQPQPGNPPN